MNCLFEESGGLKTGLVFSEADTSLQVELSTGRRLKIKRAQVLLTFAKPGPDELLPQAEAAAAGLEADFLWSCAPSEDFHFDEFAKEVFGDTASPVERAGVLLALQAAPIYFYRRGKGVFRPAPEDTIQAALAGLERKRLAAERQAALEAALRAGELPAEVAAEAQKLLTTPDKQSIVYKAVEAVTGGSAPAIARLLLEGGAMPSAYAIHRLRFFREFFPQGEKAEMEPGELAALTAARDQLLTKLPKAPAPAYSLDDASTTEVDDAFSLQQLDDGGLRVGVHIAAPGLLIKPDSPMGRLARDRASTVYYPGGKVTMLPEQLIAFGSLDEGQWCPCASIYLDFSAEGEPLRHTSKVEQVLIQQNIRHGDWEADLELAVGPETAEAERGEAISRLPWSGLVDLHRLALRLRAGREAVRGKPEPVGRIDFNFSVDWEEGEEARLVGRGRPVITERIRGSAVDTLVSEFMIHTNVRWGETLALGQLPGLYRTQSMGRVRMQTSPGPHQGMGVSHYAWSTSPLRRYADLLNQWQLLSILGYGKPAYRQGDAGVFADLAHFEACTDRYNEFQSFLERYWSQRWLGLEQGLEAESWVLPPDRPALIEAGKTGRLEGAVRLSRLPLFCKVPGWADLPPGSKVEVSVLRADALTVELEVRPHRVVEAAERREAPESPGLESAVPSAPIRLAVLGDPIAHSKSPWIHGQFAQQCGLEGVVDYQALQTPLETLAERLDALWQQGYAGLNLTIPLKEAAYALALERGWPCGLRVQQAGALNTLVRTDTGWRADNTDGLGLVRSLAPWADALQAAGQRWLIIGAGGATRGLIGPLVEAGAVEIWVANRTLSRAEALVEDLTPSVAESAAPVRLQACSLEALMEPRPPADATDWPGIVVNASSASLQGEQLALHPQLLAHARLVVDLMYGPGKTAFLTQALEAGVPEERLVDGLGMLVEQAAAAFDQWTGCAPSDTLAVLAALRERL